MKSPVKLFVIAVLLLLAGWATAYILTTPGLKPLVISIYEPPHIEADQRIQELGPVETDSKVATDFILYNKGGKHLRLFDVETSCGCTVPEISKRVIAPGDFSRLHVVLDTSIKMGKIRKKITVTSNDPKRPQLSLFLVGEVLPAKVAGHELITLHPKDKLVLFKGECATCHVQKGLGKTGKALFQADCAMCHGANAQGNHSAGPSLLLGNYDDEAFVKRIRGVIADGSPRSPQMPPFSEKHGGPLNDDEIDSLVSFLKFQSLQNKMGLLNASDTGEQEDQAAFEEALRQPH